MKLKPLSSGDRLLVRRFLSLSDRELSVYTFENIYLWKPLYDIRWGIRDDNLCIFFRDRLGCFLYLPPLGGKISLDAVGEAFAAMDSLNRRSGGISRIENIAEQDKEFFADAGYTVREKFPEYVCAREGIAKFKGNAFKSQRACFNYFIKNYRFDYRRFSLKDADACVSLFRAWCRCRKKYEDDPVYLGMAKDTLACLRFLFDHWRQFNCEGRTVRVEGVLKAFTLGFRISDDTFCVSHETTDLSVKGLSQFVFSSFAQDLEGYRYLNIMDDSGLENLKKTKLQYHPVRLMRAFTAEKRS